MITLYHGSNMRIASIDLNQCNPYKDFGQAFCPSADKKPSIGYYNCQGGYFWRRACC